MDESAITGESAPVIRESGGDRSAVTGGTRVLSDWIKVRITSNPGHTFLDRMIALVEGAERQKTPNEIALNILLAGLTIIFLLAVVTLQPFAIYSSAPQSVFVLVSLLVCLIPTTIGGLLSAIGIAGMDRLVQRNVLAMSGRAVEAAGDVHTLLLDKTGTITFGNRQATEFVPLPGVDRSSSWPTPRSFRRWRTKHRKDARSSCWPRSSTASADASWQDKDAVFVPFTAQTRMSGIDLDGRQIRKGAVDAIEKYVAASGGSDHSPSCGRSSIASPGRAARRSSSRNEPRPLGVIHLKDIVKGGIREKFADLRAMGIKTVMITGDNPLTAASIAEEAGVDDFLAEATPEDKMALIKKEQHDGKLVAMTGDGTNDAPALAQADVGVAMNTGTQAAKEAGNMVDLDSSPTKLIEIVEIGKQLLMTRGALTTFSIANDVAKYFAIIPAMFAVAFPVLAVLNIMRLQDAGVGDSLGGHLQRRHHRRARAAGASRREVQGDERRGAAAPQSLDLRLRRHCRPVHRHQDHRRDYHHAEARMNLTRNLIAATLMTIVTTRAVRAGVSAGHHRPRAGDVSRQGQRPAHRAQRRRRRIADHRPGVLVARLLSFPAVGRGHGVRPDELGRHEPGPDEQEAHRRGEGGGRGGAKGESGDAGAGRSGYLVGVRARPAHFAGGRGLSGAAHRT